MIVRCYFRDGKNLARVDADMPYGEHHHDLAEVYKDAIAEVQALLWQGANPVRPVFAVVNA